MDIKEISAEIYSNNKAKGFWDEKRNVAEMLMLVVSELSEALEADRAGKHVVYENMVRFSENTSSLDLNSPNDQEYFKAQFLTEIKDTFEDELADAVIRLFDVTHGLGIDLEFHIQHKLAYNKLRPHKHGKAY